MIESLLAEITGVDEDLAHEDPYAVCDEHLDMDFEAFERLINKLLPYCAEGLSPLTKKHYRGFAKECDGHGEWIVKLAVEKDE